MCSTHFTVGLSTLGECFKEHKIIKMYVDVVHVLVDYGETLLFRNYMQPCQSEFKVYEQSKYYATHLNTLQIILLYNLHYSRRYFDICESEKCIQFYELQRYEMLLVMSI